MLIRIFLYLHFSLFFLISISGFAEGTKQIMPFDGGAEKAHITAPAVQQYGFAWLDCPEENRLNIHIKEVGEKIYYGFQKTQVNNRTFQIRDPGGNIVFGMSMPPAGDAGYIATHAEAVEGPSQIAGPNGYDALLFLPDTIGDYSIEFQASTTLLYFDITVADTANAPIDGRIWSKAWQFSTGTNPGEFNGSLYVYADDGIVTNLDLNGMQGIIFTVACNQFGCPDPVNPGSYTRKSVNGQNVVPQFKIFVNDPDSTVYPTGTLGEISNLLITWNCDGTATITFDATLAGTVDILLNINPLPGKQPEDVLLTQPIVVGPNTVQWNGMNGLTPPEPVSNATVFDVIVTYIQGLTNFPVYDVEQNANGYIVSLIRPPGPIPNLYWDDLDLEIDPFTNCGSFTPPPPDANYDGCPGNTGCHTWLSAGTGNPSQCSYPNRNTANTWWYAVYSNSTLPLFEVHRVPDPPGDPTGPSGICPGEQQKTYTILAEPNTTSYEWDFTGLGGTFNPSGPTGLTATLDFDATATSGYIRVRGWNANCGFGDWDSTFITVHPMPVPAISGKSSVCLGESNVIYTTEAGMNAYAWSLSGGGTVTSGGSSTDNTITLTWNTVGTYSINVNFTDVNGCVAAVPTTFNVTVSILPVPTIINAPTSTCIDAIDSFYTQSGMSGYVWTVSPDGSFTGGGTDQIDVTWNTAGLKQVSVNYQMGPGCTGAAPGTTSVMVNPRPVVINSTTTDSICSAGFTSFSLLADLTGSTFAWRAFSSSPNLSGFTSGSGVNIVQIIANSGYTSEPATYRVAATAENCLGDSTDFVVTVFPVPDIFFVPNGQTICSGKVTNLSLQSNVSGTSFAWTGTGSYSEITGYGPDSGNTIQQALYNSGYMPGWATYQVAPTANGCPGTANSVIVTVDPVPVVTLTPCFDTITTINAQPIRLRGNIPLGSTFSGPGVDPLTNTFYPAFTGAGIYQIQCTYTNEFGCLDSASLSIHIADPVSHICGDTMTDIRDNQPYPTVQIGTQCWIATNLNFGNSISSSDMQRDNCISEKYCYNDNPANCSSFGGLYQWDEMMHYTSDNGGQGLCPPGWHIPTETNWLTLFNVLISSGFAGNALKYNGYSGFNALMTGIRFHNNVWKFPVSDPTLQSILYWSSTAWGVNKAWAHGMNEVMVDTEYTPSVSFYPSLRSNAFAIRCLKD